jgi:catechol 2,3-dioxygenase-like lactoylglutathione lyase family enzyme
LTSILSVTVESDDLAGAVAFWRTVLDAAEPAVLTWAPDSGSAFFELADGTRLIVSAPRRTQAAEWLGVELLTADPQRERQRLSASGLTVSEVYDTDGGSRACVVTTPEGQKFRIGTRWPLPTMDADRSGQAPRERTLP